MKKNFNELLDKNYANGLKLAGITQPTSVQQDAIPVLISGKDCIISSQTGSGKTLGYLLPIFNKINKDIKKPQAIILTPTHELASQVFKEAQMITKNCNNEVTSALIVGGANIKRQLEKLKEKPYIIIGSMGRILELIRLKKITGHYVKTIVIDEADRMLDSTNIVSLEAIIKTTLKDRQLVMASASITEDNIVQANKLMCNPEVIYSDNKIEKLPNNIEHMFLVSERRDKIDVIRKLVHSLNLKKVIVFINNPNEVENLTKRLNYHNIKSVSMHGLNNGKERRSSLESFKNGTSKVLVVSDMASRGIHIDEATHVINFDVPEEGTFYLHRAGRVGRMGHKGYCITIVDKNEKKYINKFEKEFNIKIIEKSLNHGIVIDKIK